MGSARAEGLLLQVGSDHGDGIVGLPHGWSQESAGAQFQVGVSWDEDSKGMQDGVLGEKSLDLCPCNQEGWESWTASLPPAHLQQHPQRCCEATRGIIPNFHTFSCQEKRFLSWNRM